MAAALRAEGLASAATVMIATTSETTRTALAAAAGSPASDLVETVAIAKAMRSTFGTGHPAAARALAAACRDHGADAVADALMDLAGAVETTTTPEHREQVIKDSALQAAFNTDDPLGRRRALNQYERAYGPLPSDQRMDAP